MFTITRQVIAIRSKYYVAILTTRLACESVGKIPEALRSFEGASAKNRYTKYKSALYRYWRGANIKNAEFISEMDILFPGTKRILHHPLWILLSNYIVKEDELIYLTQKLGPKLQHYLLREDEISRAVSLNDLSNSYYFKKNSHFLQLIDRRGLDELAALLIAIRAHEIKGIYTLSNTLRTLANSYFVEISKLKEFNSLITPLYKCAHELFIGLDCKHKDQKAEHLNLVQRVNIDVDYWLYIFREINLMPNTPHDHYSQILRCNRTA